jgi:outer membrane murein-binding lipoprotein Lpp
MATILTLGDVTFRENEIPEHIAVRTEHRAVIHRLVGGARVVDMLGADHAPIHWSGWFVGSTALDRALTLKSMHDDGLPLTLSWSEFIYKVVITEFEAEFQREYQIPYHISCTVVQDYLNDDGGGAVPGVDELMSTDLSTANSLSSNFPSLAAPMATLNSAISSVSSFAQAAKSTINGVLQPLNAVRSQVQVLISSTENTLMSVTTLGGILPNNPLSTQVAKLSTQINAMQNQAALVHLNSVLGRMGSNLGQINSGTKSVQVGGGNLFDLASKFYGKVSGWTALQKANPQLGSDTNISGNQTITIPPYTDDSGGVLDA